MTAARSSPARILVIKTGALGDFIQALGPMVAIRRHHPKAAITLLTTAPFVDFGRACGYFDDIWLDPRPRGRDLAGWLRWGRRLRAGGFDRVYDLQNSERTALYLWLFGGRRPEWVGAAWGASHHNAAPSRIAGHAFAGHAQTLALAGIHDVQVDDMGWVPGDAGRFGLDRPYVLLVPGCAPAHPEKRWPAARYGMLARHLDGLGFRPVVIGTAADADAAAVIRGIHPRAVDLTGKTTLFDIVLLARQAAAAFGNDTGPVHLIAATGCPVWTFFSRRSDPARATPLGPRVTVLRRDDLADLGLDEVIQAVNGKDFRS